MTYDLTIRPAQPQDSEAIFEWRNDFHTRAMSTNQHEVSWAEHEKWYNATLVREDRFLYIVELDNIAAGVVRFDHDSQNGLATISINLNPLFRGKGIASTVLQLAISTYQRDAKSPFSVIASIRKSNAASMRSFEKAGFVFTHTDGDYCLFRFS